MAGKTKDAAVENGADDTQDASANGSSSTRVTIAPGMRPVYGEVARLSTTLGIARHACYTGEPAKAVKALALLAKQLPLAQEMADLLVPSE